jgi:hypothetical protein
MVSSSGSVAHAATLEHRVNALLAPVIDLAVVRRCNDEAHLFLL